MVLVRRLQAVAIAQQRAHCLPEAVLVGLLGSVIEKGVGNKARVSSVLDVLQKEKRCVIKVGPTTFGNEPVTKKLKYNNMKAPEGKSCPLPTPSVLLGYGTHGNTINTRDFIK